MDDAPVVLGALDVPEEERGVGSWRSGARLTSGPAVLREQRMPPGSGMADACSRCV